MRSRYYYRPSHPWADEHGFVEESVLGDWQPKLAKNASIMVDRFYENTAAPDGTDIGSRRKHREYMKEHGLTTADDFTNSWQTAAKERQEFASSGKDKERREQIGRAAYEVSKRRK